MAEYDRGQRKTKSRVFTNSETRSGQLKGFINNRKSIPIQMFARLKWNESGHFISGPSTNPENIVKILNIMKANNVIDFINVREKYQNGHIVAANFGGAQDASNLVSWGDQMEEKQGDFEKTIMNGGANSRVAEWTSYPSGGTNEEGNLIDTYTVSSSGLDTSVRNQWISKVKGILVAKSDAGYEKLGGKTVKNRPSDEAIGKAVGDKYDSAIKDQFNKAISRLPTTYQLEYKPDPTHNPNARRNIKNELTEFPSITLNDSDKLFTFLKLSFISEGEERWRVK